MPPLLQATIIKQLQIVFNDKWDDTVLQAFLEKDQTPNSAVAVTTLDISQILFSVSTKMLNSVKSSLEWIKLRLK